MIGFSSGLVMRSPEHLTDAEASDWAMQETEENGDAAYELFMSRVRAGAECN